MKSNKFLGLVSVLILSSCVQENASVEDNVPQNDKYMTFQAEIAEVTKTSLSGISVLWSDKDEIAIFSDAVNNSEKYVASKGGKSTSFTGNKLAGDTFYAIYPYSTELSSDGSKITGLSIPGTQQAVPGTFSEGLNLGYASTTLSSMKLSFKNLGAVVKFALSGASVSGIEKVILTDNAGGCLAGTFEIQNLGNPDLLSLQPLSSVTLTKPEGGFKENENYYFVIAPGALQKGFSLKFIDAQGNEMVKEGTSAPSKPVVKNTILDLQTIPVQFTKTASIKIDNNFDDWNDIPWREDVKTEGRVLKAKAFATQNYVYVLLRSVKSMKADGFIPRFLFDIDNNVQTGVQNDAWGVNGAELFQQEAGFFTFDSAKNQFAWRRDGWVEWWTNDSGEYTLMEMRFEITNRCKEFNLTRSNEYIGAFIGFFASNWQYCGSAPAKGQGYIKMKVGEYINTLE